MPVVRGCAVFLCGVGDFTYIKLWIGICYINEGQDIVCLHEMSVTSIRGAILIMYYCVVGVHTALRWLLGGAQSFCVCG